MILTEAGCRAREADLDPPRMDTWYPMGGRVVSIMPWRLVDYWRMTEKPDWDHYKFG